MSKAVVRLGDPTTHGGRVISASSSMQMEGKLVALLGDLVSCPIPGHGVNPIIEGSDCFTYDGKPIVVHGNKSACGCCVISTAPHLVLS